MKYVDVLDMTTEVSEHIAYRAFSSVTDRVETDYYWFRLDGRKICIADRHVTTEQFVVKRLRVLIDEETDLASSSREETVSIMVDGRAITNVDLDAVDEFVAKLKKLNRMDLLKVLVPSWLLAEIALRSIAENIAARVKLFNDAGFVFVQSAKIVKTWDRVGPLEESEMKLSVGNHCLDLVFVEDRFVRLSHGPSKQVRTETVDWSPEWEYFIQSCLYNNRGKSVKTSVPDEVHSFLRRSSYMITH